MKAIHKKISLNFKYLSIIFCFLHALPASATDLDTSNIEQWLRAQAAFIAWGDRHQKELNKYSPPQSATEQLDADAIIEPIKKAKLYDSAANVATSQGFKSLEEWAELSIKISKTAATIIMSQQPEALSDEKIQELQKDARIPQAQKKEMLRLMEQNLALSKKLREGVSENDQKALSPFLDDIRKTMRQ